MVLILLIINLLIQSSISQFSVTTTNINLTDVMGCTNDHLGVYEHKLYWFSGGGCRKLDHYYFDLQTSTSWNPLTNVSNFTINGGETMDTTYNGKFYSINSGFDWGAWSAPLQRYLRGPAPKNYMLIYDMTTDSLVPDSSYSNTPLFWSSGNCITVNENDNIIYSVLGYQSCCPGINKGQAYNISNNSWFLIADAIYAAAGPGCAMDASFENLFTFGGTGQNPTSASISTSNGVTNAIQKYEVQTDSWQLLSETAPIFPGSWTCRLWKYDDKIYCPGGWNTATNQYYDQMYIFNPSDYSWSSVNMPDARHLISIQFYGNDCMLLIGGYASGPLDSVWQYGNCNLQSGSHAPTTAIPTINPTEMPSTSPSLSMLLLTFVP